MKKLCFLFFSLVAHGLYAQTGPTIPQMGVEITKAVPPSVDERNFFHAKIDKHINF